MIARTKGAEHDVFLHVLSLLQVFIVEESSQTIFRSDEKKPFLDSLKYERHKDKIT